MAVADMKVSIMAFVPQHLKLPAKPAELPSALDLNACESAKSMAPKRQEVFKNHFSKFMTKNAHEVFTLPTTNDLLEGLTPERQLIISNGQEGLVQTFGYTEVHILKFRAFASAAVTLPTAKFCQDANK
jgi:hypothetical protein